MQSTPLSTHRQLELMRQLQELANERARAESDVASTLAEELAAAEAAFQQTAETQVAEFAQRRRELENAFAEAKKAADNEFIQTKQRLHQAFKTQRSTSETAYSKSALAIERNKKEAEWQALAVFDAAKDGPQQFLDQAGQRLRATRQQVDGLQRDANTLMAMRRLNKAAQTVEPEFDEADSALTGSTGEQRQQANVKQLHQAVLNLQAQALPSALLEGARPWGWWIAGCVVAAAACGTLVSWSWWLTPLLGLAVGSVLAWLAYLILGKKAQRQSLRQYARIEAMLAEARNLEQVAQEEARESSRQLAEKINQQKHRDLAIAQATRDQATEKNVVRQESELRDAQQLLDTEVKQAERAREESLAAAEAKFPPLLEELAQQRQAAAQQNTQRHEQRKMRAEQAHEAAWAVLANRWHEGFQRVADELEAMRDECLRLFPDWSTIEWKDWQRPTEPPQAMQFGSCRLPLSVVKNGISDDPRLRPKQSEFELPALMPLDELPRMVISSQGAGRKVAVEVLQAMMLRFLTTMPAGKLRFTIIDPAGLGENFATFMHLADHDEQLVGTRIWTDGRQIDEQLGLLSDHMEKVLQKYLRNEFATLREYNAQAGEVAEPYHVLVIANFPAGLSDASIRKLQAISASGPRCGVYTLLGIDTSIKLPNEFDPSSLFENAVSLHWTGGQMHWDYPLYQRLPLSLDTLPPRERLNELLRATGEESREASRVEVPFAVVAPPAGELWTGSTSRELVVPVGRAGAKNLQSLKLGRGTAQHALVSGKTGSGKSTLLHALITNLALHYSPDEVEFYLVDFKKGVEFKAYASGQLPHARVIAIESEREFGVSVLERLDEELRRRGERFRELGVQDLAGARESCDDLLPRILLVIDEFQELFVTDDKLSQDAALLLDRLVRQGRAFGIHVLLGSQTLAGAYSLARSTIGQMAVRIALECSEADAHLILSDDNSAARLLSRPGEAIYNDQNGLVEGNSPFQVVWLPDAERQEYLAQIRALHCTSRDGAAADSRRAPMRHTEPMIVFEGNVPADPRDNEAFVQLLEENEVGSVGEPRFWLGSAVRIEPPTQLSLRRQSGNNVVIVGQEESLAIGILANAAIALAAQQNDSLAHITVLDGTRHESAEQGAWAELAATASGRVVVRGPSDAGRVLAELAEEVARRGASTEGTGHSARFLIMHDLAQFRNLRLSEDEFSFSSSSTNGQPPSADKQFRDLLREGPAVGVHVLLWCDSYNGLTRFLDRHTLREFDYRVAMQMSTSDSTSLIDSPAAGRVGEQRAVYYRDDLGTQVKFRPYGRPSAEWLAWVGEHLTREEVSQR